MNKIEPIGPSPLDSAFERYHQMLVLEIARSMMIRNLWERPPMDETKTDVCLKCGKPVNHLHYPYCSPDCRDTAHDDGDITEREYVRHLANTIARCREEMNR